MNSKLTITIDESLKKKATAYAGKSGKSLSQLISEYLAAIEMKTDSETIAQGKLGPVTAKLYGALKGYDLREDDYKKHLERKYPFDIPAACRAAFYT